MLSLRLQFVRQIVCASTLALSLAVLTGCQSLSSVNSSAMVRVIDVSPDAPTLDAYHGDNAVAYNLSYGVATSYVPVTPGNATFTVSPAGSRQALSSIQGAFSPNTRYTVLVHNFSSSLQQVILTDRAQPSLAKDGLKPTLRLIHQASRIGPVDVYLVPTGRRITSVAPIATDLTPGGNTGYLTVPACTCSVVMVPAGVVPSVKTASHIETQTEYEDDTARTLILLDPPPVSSAGLRVMTTLDTDSAN